MASEHISEKILSGNPTPSQKLNRFKLIKLYYMYVKFNGFKKHWTKSVLLMTQFESPACYIRKQHTKLLW